MCCLRIILCVCVCVCVLAPTLFNHFFDAVVSMALERHSGNGLAILFNTNAKLVGDRKKMREQFLIIPILLYGSESWTPLSQHIKRLQGFVMRCLRIILAYWLDRSRGITIFVRRQALRLLTE